jgi:hypothetical protein
MTKLISGTYKQETLHRGGLYTDLQLQRGGLYTDLQVNHPVAATPCPLHFPSIADRGGELQAQQRNFGRGLAVAPRPVRRGIFVRNVARVTSSSSTPASSNLGLHPQHSHELR